MFSSETNIPFPCLKMAKALTVSLLFSLFRMPSAQWSRNVLHLTECIVMARSHLPLSYWGTLVARIYHHPSSTATFIANDETTSNPTPSLPSTTTNYLRPCGESSVMQTRQLIHNSNGLRPLLLKEEVNQPTDGGRDIYTHPAPRQPSFLT